MNFRRLTSYLIYQLIDLVIKIPILETEKIGLYVTDKHGYEINQPSEITFLLPKPDDKRTHGYTPQYIKVALKRLTYNNWYALDVC